VAFFGSRIPGTLSNRCSISSEAASTSGWNGKAPAGAHRAGVCPKHDHRERTRRDLDFCGDQPFSHALVPRVDCAEHGVVTVAIPWSAGRSELTERFERITTALICEMSVAAVSRRMAVSWNQVDAIMMRAVERGRTRQQPRLVRHLGIDEKAIKKGHRYFSLVSDLDAGVVLFVGHGRKRATIDAFWAGLSRERLAAVEGVAMAMWQPYFDSTMAYIPDAASKIVFDRFHVTAYLTKAVDLTRRAMMRDRSLNREDVAQSHGETRFKSCAC